MLRLGGLRIDLLNGAYRRSLGASELRRRDARMLVLIEIRARVELTKILDGRTLGCLVPYSEKRNLTCCAGEDWKFEMVLSIKLG